MIQSAPHRIVLLGCGHSHAGVLRSLGLRPIPNAKITLVTREILTPYSGMLPGYIAGHYRFEQMHIDAPLLSRFADACLVHDEAIGLDLDDRRVLLNTGAAVAFDILSIDIGSVSSAAMVEGAAEHARQVKPVDRFLPKFDALIARVLARAGSSRILVVGGGAGGVELMLSVQRRLRAEFAAVGRSRFNLAFTLVTADDVLLPAFNSRTRATLEAILGKRGVKVIRSTSVDAVEPGQLLCSSGKTISADEILWVTEGAAAPWLKETALALDGRGYIRVSRELESVSHTNVFATGDIASFDGRDLPKSGVWAVRETRPLTTNLRRVVAREPLLPYHPQRRALAIVSTGNKYAVADRGWFSVKGRWVWRWKDWIDRRFMRSVKQFR